jgi:hypothetical protein
MFVSLVYCAKSTVRWFVVRGKHCWMAADSADKSKRTGRKLTWLAKALQYNPIRRAMRATRRGGMPRLALAGGEHAQRRRPWAAAQNFRACSERVRRKETEEEERVLIG